jgi:hypothetical protein
MNKLIELKLLLNTTELEFIEESFSYNETGFDAEGLLYSLKNLKRLSIVNCDYPPKCFNKLVNLEELKLILREDVPFNDVGIYQLPKSLKILEVSNERFIDIGENLEELIFKNSKISSNHRIVQEFILEPYCVNGIHSLQYPNLKIIDLTGTGFI